jgi:hypothetical protein
MENAEHSDVNFKIVSFHINHNPKMEAEGSFEILVTMY